MANLGNTYDASNGQTMEDRDVLPAGEYLAAICKSEKREAKSNPQNRYLNMEFEVTSGEFQGRRFWTMLNLWNVNDQTVSIAQRELNSICHAVGKLRIADTEELHGIPMLVKLGVKKDNSYGDQNVVKGYKPANGAASGGASNTHSAGGGKSGPWNNAA